MDAEPYGRENKTSLRYEPSFAGSAPGKVMFVVPIKNLSAKTGHVLKSAAQAAKKPTCSM